MTANQGAFADRPACASVRQGGGEAVMFGCIGSEVLRTREKRQISLPSESPESVCPTSPGTQKAVTRPSCSTQEPRHNQ